MNSSSYKENFFNTDLFSFLPDFYGLVFRIKQFDERRGFRRYFWKAVPKEA